MNTTIDKEVELAIQSLKLLISLTPQSKFNLLRFEDCRNKVLSLHLSEQTMRHLHKCFQKASRYAEFGEIGAFKFELNLMIELLKNQQDTY